MMTPDEASAIDALARARNRADGHGSCLPAVLITLAAWIIIAALAFRFFKGF